MQEIAPGLYMQRRDITSKVKPGGPDGMGGYSYYESQSRKITAAELAMLQSIKEIDTAKAIDAFTMELIEEGML